MQFIRNGRLYDTQTSGILCSNEYATSSSNRLNNGRATILYQTPKGAFWFLHETMWQGETDWVEPTTKEEASHFAETRMATVEYQKIFGPVELA